MDRILSGLGKRVFLMNNVHDDRPVVFQTRWTLSYLRGPLTREQIQTLMAPRKQAGAGGTSPVGRGREVGIVPEVAGARLDRRPRRGGARPVVPPDVPVAFVPRRGPVEAGESLLYRPAILGVARLHYADKKAGVDHWETLALLHRIDDEMPAGGLGRQRAVRRRRAGAGQGPRGRARFAPLPSELARAKSYPEWTKSLKNYLYRERTLDLWTSPAFKETSRPSESEREFRLRLAQASRERRDQDVAALRAKYAPSRPPSRSRSAAPGSDWSENSPRRTG